MAHHGASFPVVDKFFQDVDCDVYIVATIRWRNRKGYVMSQDETDQVEKGEVQDEHGQPLRVLFKYGVYLIRTGKPEQGLIEMKRHLELDPLSPVARRNVARAYFRNRQYDDAIEHQAGLPQAAGLLEREEEFVDDEQAKRFKELGGQHRLRGPGKPHAAPGIRRRPITAAVQEAANPPDRVAQSYKWDELINDPQEMEPLGSHIAPPGEHAA